MPGRHSLLWRLSALLCLSAVLAVSLGWALTQHVGNQAMYLSGAARTAMQGFAEEAERAWLAGPQALDTWLAEIREREGGDAVVITPDGESLMSAALTEHQRAGLRFQRELHFRMSTRSTEMPFIGVPFPHHPDAGRLVMQLPKRYFPGGSVPLWRLVLLGGLPGAVALIMGALIYRGMMRPLRDLEQQVLSLRDDPAARVSRALASRRDEFGQLGASFNDMAERVADVLGAQRQMLHDMSHELRTPLSRLSVALDGELPLPELRERVARELALMSALVDDTLELAWHDVALPRASTEPVAVAAMWDLVVENVAFETGWPVTRFPNHVPDHARVAGNVNDLARVLENLLRNAVRHSPADGRVALDGVQEEGFWHLWVTDQGPGIPEAALERIFEPFVRLDLSRGPGTGFGLGLSIARRAVTRQGGMLWAENGQPGLRVHLRLRAAESAAAGPVSGEPGSYKTGSNV